MTNLSTDQQLIRAGKIWIKENSTASEAGRLLQCSLRADCEAVFKNSPMKRAKFRAALNVLARAPRATWGDLEVEFERSLRTRALGTGDSGLGQALSVLDGLHEDVYVLLPRYRAFRDFLVPMDAGKKRLAQVTGKPSAVWLKPASQGTTIPTDASITGSSISPEVATVAALVEISGEVLSDGAVTFEAAVLTAIVEGLGYQLDWTCFQADGTDDQANGGMTGILEHGSVPVFTSARTSVATLLYDDFADTIAEVASSALQYPCRWWISPAFLPDLLKVRAGEDRAGDTLLKPPTAADEDWRLVGFPVTWTDGMPSTEAGGDKVAAFGRTDALTVALRQDFEITSSAATAKWAQNIYQLRALARARIEMRDATSLATLALGA